MKKLSGILFFTAVIFTSCTKEETPKPGGKGSSVDPNGRPSNAMVVDEGPRIDPLGRGFSIDPNGGH